jgi:putative YphP/YqiW family bacilliredoxin
MYPPELVKPMKDDLLNVGFNQLETSPEVDAALEDSKGLLLVVVNSVCGCAAANARPAAKMSLTNAKVPSRAVTVFAGVDTDAVDQARNMMVPFPPSSPSMALFKDGELVHMIERHHIEGRAAQAIAENLMEAYNEFC